MDLSILAVASISFFVAYVNGANDVSKGIATLAGSGVSNYRRATCGALYGRRSAALLRLNFRALWSPLLARGC